MHVHYCVKVLNTLNSTDCQSTEKLSKSMTKHLTVKTEHRKNNEILVIFDASTTITATVIMKCFPVQSSDEWNGYFFTELSTSLIWCGAQLICKSLQGQPDFLHNRRKLKVFITNKLKQVWSLIVNPAERPISAQQVILLFKYFFDPLSYLIQPIAKGRKDWGETFSKYVH